MHLIKFVDVFTSLNSNQGLLFKKMMRERERERVRRKAREKDDHCSRWDVKVNSNCHDKREVNGKKDFNIDFLRKTTTFFFSNFPYYWNEKGPWKIFDKLGHIVDIFIVK